MDNFSKHIVRFNAFQIKIIALITMTLDHIGAYQTFTFSREINDGLRVVGRIAAPLFLFMVGEGLCKGDNQTADSNTNRFYMSPVIANVLYAENK